MELYKMTFDPEYWKRSFHTKNGHEIRGMLPYSMLIAVVEREFDKMIKSIVDYEHSSEDRLDDPTLSKIEEDGVNIIRECMVNATFYCMNDYRGCNISNFVIARGCNISNPIITSFFKIDNIFKNLFDEDKKPSHDLSVDERLTPMPQWMHDLSNKYDYDDPFMVLIYRLHHALLLAEEGIGKIIEPHICEEDTRIQLDKLDFPEYGDMSVWFGTSDDYDQRERSPLNKRYICPKRSNYEKDHTIEYDEMCDHNSDIVKNHYKSIGTKIDISDEMCELFDVDTCYRHALAYDDITIIIYFVYKRN